MNWRRAKVAAGLIVLVACDAGDSALAGRDYLPTIPRSELPGVWAPVSNSPTLLYSLFGSRRAIGPRTLVIRDVGTCDVSLALAEQLVECEHAPVVDSELEATCAWRVEGPPQAERLRVLFRDVDGKVRAASFGGYRHSMNGDVALLWTCGLGDVAGLFHQGTVVP